LRPFDASGKFQVDVNERAEVRRLAVRGVGVTVFSQGALLAIQMISTVVLARLLTPADFGVVAMVLTFSMLLTTFAGFTEAVLQREVIDRSLVSNVFWICTGIGVLLTIGFAATGPLLARFYGDPRVVLITVVLSLQILITSTSILHLALLNRALRFSLVSINEIVARVVSVIISISLALAGWGYWALVAGVLAFPLSRAIGAWILCRWTPSVPRRKAGTGSMVRYSVNVYGRACVDSIANNMDNALVGWRFGAESLGLYKKAYDLFALPASLVVRPLTAVAVSALSRLKDDPVRYRRYFLNALTVTAFLGMGLAADLTLIGKDLIRFLLGPQWVVSGRIFVLLGPGIGLMFIYITHRWVHLSIGTTNRFLRWGLLELAITGLLFILALSYGPEGIAVAWTTSYAILTLPAFWYAGRPIHFGILPVVSSIWKFVLASALAGCVSAVAARFIPSFSGLPVSIGSLARVILISALFVPLYLAAVIVLHRSLAPLNQLVRLLKEMLPPSWASRLGPATGKTDESPRSGIIGLASEETTASIRG
jgi:polysaccharide transporter, PST family